MNMLVNVAAVCVFFGGLVFAGTYHLLAPWWRSAEGINFMTMAGALTGIFGLRCLALVLGDGYWGQTAVRLLFFVVIGAALWHRWTLLIKAQLRRRDEPREP